MNRSSVHVAQWKADVILVKFDITVFYVFNTYIIHFSPFFYFVSEKDYFVLSLLKTIS